MRSRKECSDVRLCEDKCQDILGLVEERERERERERELKAEIMT